QSLYNRYTFLSSLTVTPSLYIYSLSLHDALPIYMTVTVEIEEIKELMTKSLEIRGICGEYADFMVSDYLESELEGHKTHGISKRSEEHTSELQSRFELVCRLLLEKKKHDKHGCDR